MVAFANTNGGKLLVGVKDNGKIAGIRTDEEFYMVEAAAKIYSNPPINFSTQQWQIEGKTVLEIQIEPSTTKPHFAKNDDGKWLAYIRVHDENIGAQNPAKCLEKKQQPNRYSFYLFRIGKILIDYLQKIQQLAFQNFCDWLIFQEIRQKKY